MCRSDEIVFQSKSGSVHFCNVTDYWDEGDRSYIYILVPVLLAAILTLACWSIAFSRSTKNVFFEDCRQVFKGFPGCQRCWYERDWLIALFGITSFIAGEALEIFDVFTDTYLYVDVYNGKELDPKFYRNRHVLKAMFVFACFGVFLIPLTIFMKNLRGRSDNRGRPGTFKSSTAKLLTLIMEDAPETLLQYFYVEKYTLDGHLPMYKLICVVGKLLKELAGCVDIVRRFYRSEECIGSEKVYVICTAVLHLMIMVMNFLRLSGALKQQITGQLEESCAAVTEAGRLIQTPFKPGCLNELDIALLSFIILCCVFAIWFVIGYFRKLFKTVGGKYRGIQIRYR